MESGLSRSSQPRLRPTLYSVSTVCMPSTSSSLRSPPTSVLREPHCGSLQPHDSSATRLTLSGRHYLCCLPSAGGWVQHNNTLAGSALSHMAFVLQSSVIIALLLVLISYCALFVKFYHRFIYLYIHIQPKLWMIPNCIYEEDSIGLVWYYFPFQAFVCGEGWRAHGMCPRQVYGTTTQLHNYTTLVSRSWLLQDLSSACSAYNELVQQRR